MNLILNMLRATPAVFLAGFSLSVNAQAVAEQEEPPVVLYEVKPQTADGYTPAPTGAYPAN